MGNHTKEELKEYMLKEIDIVQDIIKRMASNSFMIKGWTVALVAITLLLKGEKYHVFIAYIPIFVFWYLDAYFLRLERLYRRLYKWIIDNRLRTDEYLFDMDYRRFEKQEQTVLRIMFSKTIGLFYGSILLITLIYTIITFKLGKGGV